jgi:hypothetical protein
VAASVFVSNVAFAFVIVSYVAVALAVVKKSVEFTVFVIVKLPLPSL